MPNDSLGGTEHLRCSQAPQGLKEMSVTLTINEALFVNASFLLIISTHSRAASLWSATELDNDFPTLLVGLIRIPIQQQPLRDVAEVTGNTRMISK